MGPDMQKKRKAPAAASPSIKKSRKSPSKPTSKPAAPSPAPVKKAARKTAAELMSDDDKSDDEAAGWEALNGDGKKKKGKQTTLPPKNKAKAKAREAARAAAKRAKPEEKKEEEEKVVEEESEAEIEDSEDEDDQAVALLKGFESEDEEERFVDVVVDGKEIVKSGLPDEKKTKKKLKAAAKKQEKTVPGVIYLGRVPHGFYEHEMRAYFTQFGNVTRLRLSRNKTTGKSKHYAFIEFDDADVAQIVADTMNNYLLFGHILKCKTVPRDNLEYIEKLFKGANKRYKPRPVSKLAKAELEKKRTEETWEGLVKKENNKRKSITARLQAKGIEYEFEAPVAKKAKQEAVKAIEPEVLSEPVPAVEDKVEDTITVASVIPKEKVPAKKSKAKKTKKSKA